MVGVQSSGSPSYLVMWMPVSVLGPLTVLPVAVSGPVNLGEEHHSLADLQPEAAVRGRGERGQQEGGAAELDERAGAVPEPGRLHGSVYGGGGGGKSVHAGSCSDIHPHLVAPAGCSDSDVECLKLAGTSGVPADASTAAKMTDSFTCTQGGGYGAVQEFAEHIITLMESGR